MNQIHCEDLARKIGAEVWEDDNRAFVRLTLWGREYMNYFYSWKELCAAMVVLADMTEYTPKEE